MKSKKINFENMKIIDISWPITKNCTEYKNKKTVQFEFLKNFDQDNVRDSIITLGSHTGTHIDAPAHFLENGKTIDQINLEKFIGKAKVLDLTHVQEKITEQNLDQFYIVKDDIILLKTKNSLLSETQNFEPNFVYLEKSGAEFLAKKEVKTVGIDYLGIERNQPDHETHKILLEKEIVIIEGLRLKDATEKEYFFYCLPIFTVGLEAAPARAILIK
ncbi:cyclase family protein [Candidatus Babeliales bacterium]|nr:cyclase family protein [Candidatus Babeliales bacterium]